MNPSSKRLLAALATVLAIFVLAWFLLDGSTVRSRVIRSRLTVVVNTPEGERIGSSVTQQTFSFPGGLTKAQGWGLWTEFVGEAVVVDLGQRGLLFATLRKKSLLTRSGGGGPGGGYNGGMMPFPQEKFRGIYAAQASTTEKFAAYLDELNRVRPKSDLAVQDLPVLVRFGDLNDPKSVALVDPLNLAASFGPGVTLKGAIVEITDAAVTRGIDAQLPWLKSGPFDQPLFPNPTHKPVESPSLVQLLTYEDFRSFPR